ncbi:MAG: fatty acid desaturase [Verrucomicrobia bacterium]|nr:fatty acid desaturase [Verrucomicrobiota bacterium]MBI3867790.1 fatty acid desaturase [Verrucomicrobiota bacterium]
MRQSIANLRTSRSNLRGVLELGSTYLFIAIALWAVHRPAHWLVYPIAFVWIGMMQYRLVMSSHEAVHKTLLSPVWLNETFGSVNAALVGISFFNYRKTHLDHHKSPQYIRDDSDAYIYKPLLQTRPGLPRLALLLFGVWVDVYVKLRRKLSGVRPDESKSTAENATDSQLWLIALLQLALLAGFALTSAWWFYFVFWFAPIFCVALTLDRVRTFVEHSYHFLFCESETRVDQALQATVDIQTNALEAYFLAPFGFDYHQAHHAQLTVPFYNLRRLSDLLLAHDARYNARVKGSYLAILTRMIWASK